MQTGCFLRSVHLSPQESEWAIHARCLLCELWLFHREIANAFHQRYQGWDVGEAQHDVNDAPVPGPGVELVHANAAQQQGQDACGDFAFF